MQPTGLPPATEVDGYGLWFLLPWVIGTGLLFVTFAVAALLERRPPAPRVPPRARSMALHPLFLESDGQVFEMDGLLEVGDDAERPVALRLQRPGTPLLADLVGAALRRWTDEDRTVEIDLSRLDRRRPSVELAAGGTRVRLDVADARDLLTFGPGPSSAAGAR